MTGAVYVTRKDGKGPTLDEVKTLLQSYKTTEMWSPTRTEIEAYGLGSGIWVRFELFGECKDAVKVSFPLSLIEKAILLTSI